MNENHPMKSSEDQNHEEPNQEISDANHGDEGQEDNDRPEGAQMDLGTADPDEPELTNQEIIANARNMIMSIFDAMEADAREEDMHNEESARSMHAQLEMELERQQNLASLKQQKFLALQSLLQSWSESVSALGSDE